MNTQKHCGNWPVVATVLRLHTLTATRTGHFLASVKLTYIKLNRSTPCPPRSAVPVNRPFNSLRRCWAVSGPNPVVTADYTANLLNQYSQRTVPAYAEISGLATNGSVLSFKNENTGASIRAGRNGEWFHAFMPLSDNSSVSVSNTVRMIGVIPGAGTNGVDLINTNETLTLAAMKTPEVFTYDDDGNLLSDGRLSYTWNAENRLIEVQSGTGILPVIHATYAYDHQGRMVSRTLNDATTTYLWDGWNVISETSSATTNSYVWGVDLSGTLQGAGGVGGLVAASLNGTSVFYACDGNGNVSDLIDDAGTVVAHYEYDPFGNEIVNQQSSLGNAINPWRFSTKYFEPETGLLHYELRPYSPSIGKWLSRDSLGERGGLDIYHFVFNNPIRWVDYNGLWGNGNDGNVDGSPGSRGHSDFPGHNIFNYTVEDEGKTSPFNPQSTWRHFRPLDDSEGDLVKAVKDCNKNDFERASHQMQDFFSHYGQGYRASTNLNYATLVGSGHGLGSAGAPIARGAGFGVARPDNAADYQDAYAAAERRTQYWLDRWKKCCCGSKDSWKKIPRRPESDCSASAPENEWGEHAPEATPENGYWRRGWNTTKGWF